MLYVNPLAERMIPPADGALNSAKRRHEVLQQFEQLLVYQMLHEMRKSVPQGGLFEKSSTMQYYEEMQDDFCAGQLARSGQLGITKLMEAQIAENEKPHDLGAFSGGIALHPASKALSLSHERLQALPLESLRNNPGLPINTPAATGLPLRRTES